MFDRILVAITPDRFQTQTARRVWMGVVVLFPVAFLAAFFILLRTEPRSPIPVTITVPKAVDIARSFAIREGIPAGTWKATHGYSNENQQLDFINAKPERQVLWNVAPPLHAIITLTQPNGNQSARVLVSLDEKIVGFEWKNAPATGPPLSDAEAQNLADARLAAGLTAPLSNGVKPLQFGPPLVSKKDKARVYTYRSSNIPDVDVKAAITVDANRVVSYQVSAEPTTPVVENEVQSALTVAGIIFVCVVTIFSIYRYASRTLQQEVSHRRSLIVALLCGFFCVIISSNAVVNGETGNAPAAFIAMIFAIVGTVGGMLLAAAYGSGEGDVREAYPGKLTSLDALLTGRVFSHNVGVSALFGVVCASWLTLLLALVTLPFRHTAVQGSQVMGSPMMRMTWLMPFVTYPLMALAFAAAALLQPLAFMQRYTVRARRFLFPALALSGGLVSMIRIHSDSLVEFLARSAIFVVGLLIPFFLGDLLASLVCITALFALINVVSSISILPYHHFSHLLLGGVSAATFLVAIFSTLFGKTYTEEQVRPLYARNLAQRKSLEAEVSAAREAQLRLLPESAPDLAGLSISANCVPAETVGGDFYDFFRLGDGRLGVFIAEGNSRGLAAALTIALAKGYLMHCVERFREPVDLLSRLETTLASIFEGTTSDSAASPTDFAFAVIDIDSGEIHYARTGAYPKVVVASTHGTKVTERLVPVRGRATPIAEGSAILAPGDRIVMFTDGIGRRLAGPTDRNPEEVAAILASREASNVDEIGQRFLSESKASTDPDDLTVVIVEMQAVRESRLEVVA